MTKILIGGSPCTHWSIVRAKGLPVDRETAAEGIGWELFKNYDIAKKKFEPDFFIYENVASMAQDIKQQICSTFGSEPLQINGALVSAAERDRYYWTNIANVEQPKEKGIVLKDILENDVDQAFFYDKPLLNIDMSKQVCATIDIKINEMHRRVFNPNFKVHTLTTCAGGNLQKKVLVNGRARKMTPTEYERCMTLPDGYTKAVANTNRYNGLGNGWTAEVIIHILRHANIPFNEEIQVLSMYDGIATGRYCLEKMGYKNIKYCAYEIEQSAMKIANSNYPDIIQRGDAFQLRDASWKY